MANEEAKKTSGRGGRREGSGRKALGKKAEGLASDSENEVAISQMKRINILYV